jgi:hypothetical protein
MTQALAPQWRYPVAMTSIQVKDVPDDVHATLRRRAAAAGQSLQEYLLAQLTEAARKPTIAELFERVEQRTGGSFSGADAVAAIRADRDAR